VPALLRGREWLINKDHLHKLIDLGLVEMREDVPNLQTPVEKQRGRSIEVNDPDPFYCWIRVKKIPVARHTAPAEGVPGLSQSALVRGDRLTDCDTNVNMGIARLQHSREYNVQPQAGRQQARITIAFLCVALWSVFRAGPTEAVDYPTLHRY